MRPGGVPGSVDGIAGARPTTLSPGRLLSDTPRAQAFAPCDWLVELMHARKASRIAYFLGETRKYFPVAVPEKIIGLTLFLDFFDRCLSLTSLHLPPAALGSLPVFELVAAICHRHMAF